MHLRSMLSCERSSYFKNRSEEHTSELQSRQYIACRLLFEKNMKTLTCAPSASTSISSLSSFPFFPPFCPSFSSASPRPALSPVTLSLLWLHHRSSSLHHPI